MDFIRLLLALIIVSLVAVAAFAAIALGADPIAAHDATGMDVAGVLTMFHVSGGIQGVIILILAGLYAIITEVLPFCPRIKANGLFHFFYLAFKAMRVDPDAQTVAVDPAALRAMIAEMIPAPLPGPTGPQGPAAAPVEIPAPVVSPAPVAAVPTPEEVAAAQATLAAAAAPAEVASAR